MSINLTTIKTLKIVFSYFSLISQFFTTLKILLYNSPLISKLSQLSKHYSIIIHQYYNFQNSQNITLLFSINIITFITLKTLLCYSPLISQLSKLYPIILHQYHKFHNTQNIALLFSINITTFKTLPNYYPSISQLSHPQNITLLFSINNTTFTTT